MHRFFETIRIENGLVSHLEYHQKRYESVLLAHGQTKVQKLSSFIDPPKKGLYRCKVIYNCVDEDLEVLYFPYTAMAVKKLQIVYEDAIEYTYKSTQRDALEKLLDRCNKCDEVLIVKNGLLTDTSKANIALYKEKKWWTPKGALLKGTTRQRLLEEQKIFESDLDVNALKSCEKIALMNAMIGFQVQDDCEILL